LAGKEKETKKDAKVEEKPEEKQLSSKEIVESFFDVIPEKEPIVVSIIADGGFGKTHFCNTFPNPVFNDTEGRARILAKKFPNNKDYIKHTPNMQTIRETISLMFQHLCPDESKRHEWTWVMDSGSDWLQMAETEYLKEAKKEKVYPTILWAQVYNKIDKVFDMIRKMGFNAVITQQLKEKYVGDKGTGEFIASGYKKFPYRVDVSLFLKKGIEYDGNIYYEDFVVAEVLKSCWQSPEERKPYLLDYSYNGIYNELKPYVYPGSPEKAIQAILKEMEEKTGIPIEKAKKQK
jgi:hypothetical protein